jgi:hypothetical protein
MDADQDFQEQSPDSGTLNADQILAAIEHLYKALEILHSTEKDLDGEAVSGADLSSKLAEGWLEVNKCRVYTERVPDLEELLVPCLGSLNDARSMLESIFAWQLGITHSAYLNIVNCIDEAIEEGIRPCLEELEQWLNGLAH